MIFQANLYIFLWKEIVSQLCPILPVGVINLHYPRTLPHKIKETGQSTNQPSDLGQILR